MTLRDKQILLGAVACAVSAALLMATAPLTEGSVMPAQMVLAIALAVATLPLATYAFRRWLSILVQRGGPPREILTAQDPSRVRLRFTLRQ